jgi:toxin ParE1/3/4
MNSYALTRRAETDLFDILLFGYEQFGTRQAEAYANELEHVFQLLADNPRMGREAQAIAPGVRRHEHASHIILYEIAPEGILILAVVHARSIKRLTLD